MNSAFIHHHGAKKAGRLVRCAALACALVLGGGGSAWAQQHGDRRDDQGMQQYPQQYPQQSPRFRLPQDHGQRDDARGYDDQRRAPPQYQQDQRDQQHDSSRRSGRMTPDERRDLRRQINEAGMDLYPPKRR